MVRGARGGTRTPTVAREILSLVRLPVPPLSREPPITTPSAHDKSAAGKLLELDDVALGVTDVDRRPHAMRAVALRGIAHHLDPLCAQRGDDPGHVLRLDAEAEVLDVADRPRAALGGRGHEVDQAPSGAELNEAERVHPPLLEKPEDPHVEVERARLVRAAQHDVVELGDAKRPHVPTLGLSRRRAEPRPSRRHRWDARRTRAPLAPLPADR